MTHLLTLTAQLRLVGATLVLLGVAHLAMPAALGWPAEFTALRPLTRQIMRAHTFFIGVTCALLGLAPLTMTADLLTGGRLPTAVLAAECAFWGLRWGAQFTVFRPAVWRGPRWYAAGYLGLALLWTWVGAVFALALARQIG
jgi:hypothetical protein